MIQVQTEHIDFDCGTVINHAYYPLLVQEQCEMIRSMPILKAVVKELSLHEKLIGEPYGVYGDKVNIYKAVQLVREKLTLKIHEKWPDVILITVKFDKPNQEPNQAAHLAADTVNAIASALQASVLAQVRNPRMEALNVVQRELEAQTRKINELSKISEDDENYDTVQSELKALKERRDLWEDKLLEEKMKLTVPSMSISIIEPAKKVDNPIPVSPNRKFNIIVSFLVGLFLGSVIAIIFLKNSQQKNTALTRKKDYIILVCFVISVLLVAWCAHTRAKNVVVDSAPRMPLFVNGDSVDSEVKRLWVMRAVTHGTKEFSEIERMCSNAVWCQGVLRDIQMFSRNVRKEDEHIEKLRQQAQELALTDKDRKFLNKVIKTRKITVSIE